MTPHRGALTRLTVALLVALGLVLHGGVIAPDTARAGTDSVQASAAMCGGMPSHGDAPAPHHDHAKCWICGHAGSLAWAVPAEPPMPRAVSLDLPPDYQVTTAPLRPRLAYASRAPPTIG